MKRNAGFTLVEVMVTILMVGVATATISSVFISIRNIQLRASYYDSAYRAAGREIEALRNDSYDNLIAGQTIDFTSSLPTNLPHSNGSAAITSPSADIRRIDATVTYQSQGKTQTIELSSLIGEIGITQ